MWVLSGKKKRSIETLHEQSKDYYENGWKNN